jgi:hypothetical protein
MKNNNLHSAKKAKNDEFYTTLSDIEKELKHYTEHFKGKVVYCNCDDHRKSNFFRYFFLNFKALGMKRLICTGFKKDGHGVKYVTDVGDENGNGLVDFGELETTELDGDGSYDSPECMKLLEESDIVVTNPPFSLFRPYMKTLVDYGKKYLVIGNINALKYKEVFPLIKENKMWLGCTSFNTGMYFGVPEDYEYKQTYKFDRERNGRKVMRVPAVCWFTNLEHSKRHEKLTLVERYDRNEYPKYDNYDAIEVSHTVRIPKDYSGVMGVPITFLDKYCPEQFEIVGEANNGSDNEYDLFKPLLNGKFTYSRILIRAK